MSADHPNAFEQDQIYMQEAIRQARLAEQNNDVPIGAVIVQDDRIIGKGFNRREMDGSPLAHAELMAIEQASRSLGGWRLTNCCLYVTLEPCPMCAGAIVQSRIKRLVYGTADPKSGYAGSLYNTLQDERLNHQTEVAAGICSDACRDLLQHFFNQLRGNNRGSGK